MRFGLQAVYIRYCERRGLYPHMGITLLKQCDACQGLKIKYTVVGDQVGGPTCARDIAQTCISIAEQLIKHASKSGVYHYSGRA